MDEVIAAITSAINAADISQRTLAERSGISQPTLNRILNGKRALKATEVLLIADAIGCTVSQLTGSDVSRRVECAARTTNGTDMTFMRQRLVHFLELDAYLDEYAIPEL